LPEEEMFSFVVVPSKGVLWFSSYTFAGLVDMNASLAVLAVTNIASRAPLIRVFVVHESSYGNLTTMRAIVESRIVRFELHGIYDVGELLKDSNTGDALDLSLGQNEPAAGVWTFDAIVYNLEFNF